MYYKKNTNQYKQITHVYTGKGELMSGILLMNNDQYLNWSDPVPPFNPERKRHKINFLFQKWNTVFAL